MNIFNRVIAFVLLLALLALVLWLALAPIAAITSIQQLLEGFKQFLQRVDANSPILYMLARIGIVILALVVFLPLLWQEIRPRRSGGSVKVRTESGAQTTVTSDSVARRLSWHIDQVADVISVTPKVAAKGSTVDVMLDLETAPEVDVPMKTEEVVALAREVLQQQMGLQVGKVRVNVRHVPYAEGA